MSAASGGRGPRITRRPVVGVMGSGTERHERRARDLGRFVAESGWHLLTGGGQGVMAEVSEAFCAVSGRAGLSVGVLPCAPNDPLCPTPEGYPNPWVEIPIRTHLPLLGDAGDLPLSRNHLNILSADVVVALPGAAGTSSEVRLAIRYARPVFAYVDRRDQIPDLPADVPVLPTIAELRQALTVTLA